jgi:hypothetical protein
MKKYFLALLVISLIVFTSGCTSNSDQNTNKTKTLSQNNISFDYPGAWVLGNSKVNGTIAAVADPNSVNSQTGYAETVVTVEEKNLTGTMYSMYQQNYATLFNNSSYQRVSESNLTLGNIQALENVYTVDYNGVKKQQRAVWIQNGRQVYVILCSALADQYENEKNNFDLVVNSFKFS